MHNNLGFYILSNVWPAAEGYNVFTVDEVKFFKAFAKSLTEVNLHPNDITLTRLGDATFNVDTPYGYIGKIALNPIVTPDKYAVKKQGGTRALRVFLTEQEAIAYLDAGKGDFIEFRSGNSPEFYMQYLIGLYSIKELYTKNVEDCINTIPRWIKYIKYCKRTSF